MGLKEIKLLDKHQRDKCSQCFSWNLACVYCAIFILVAGMFSIHQEDMFNLFNLRVR